MQEEKVACQPGSRRAPVILTIWSTRFSPVLSACGVQLSPAFGYHVFPNSWFRPQQHSWQPQKEQDQAQLKSLIPTPSPQPHSKAPCGAGCLGSQKPNPHPANKGLIPMASWPLCAHLSAWGPQDCFCSHSDCGLGNPAKKWAVKQSAAATPFSVRSELPSNFILTWVVSLCPLH